MHQAVCTIFTRVLVFPNKRYTEYLHHPCSGSFFYLKKMTLPHSLYPGLLQGAFFRFSELIFCIDDNIFGIPVIGPGNLNHPFLNQIFEAFSKIFNFISHGFPILMNPVDEKNK
jgi:hypothetical protein